MSDDTDHTADVGPTQAEKQHLQQRRKETADRQTSEKKKKRRELLYGKDSGTPQQNVDAFHGLFTKPPKHLGRNLASAEGTVNDRVCTRVGDVFVAGAGITAWTRQGVSKATGSRKKKDRQPKQPKDKQRPFAPKEREPKPSSDDNKEPRKKKDRSR